MSKEQMTIRLYPETRRQMDSWLEESNSKNRNEFVEKALPFIWAISARRILPSISRTHW